MPDLPDRQRCESCVSSALMPIFRRWESELLAADGDSLPVLVVSESDREAIAAALAIPFSRASANLAGEISLPLDESMAMLSAMFVADYANVLADLLASSTNKQVAAAAAKIAAEDSANSDSDVKVKAIGSTLKSIGRRVVDAVKDVLLGAQRAAKVAATETTRMVTAGERLVANVWNRTVGRNPALRVRGRLPRRPAPTIPPATPAPPRPVSRPSSTPPPATPATPTTAPRPPAPVSRPAPAPPDQQTIDQTRPQPSPDADSDADEIPDDQPVELVARWNVETTGSGIPDGKVCPLCFPLHLLFEDEWPPEASGGSPRHVSCRCYLTWEVRPVEYPEAA